MLFPNGAIQLWYEGCAQIRRWLVLLSIVRSFIQRPQTILVVVHRSELKRRKDRLITRVTIGTGMRAGVESDPRVHQIVALLILQGIGRRVAMGGPQKSIALDLAATPFLDPA